MNHILTKDGKHGIFMNLKDPEWARVQDALYYLDPASGASIDRAKGVLIGIVSTLMLFGIKNFSDIWRILIPLMPRNFRVACIPPTWRNGENMDIVLNLNKVISYQGLIESLEKLIGEEEADKVKEDIMDRYLGIVTLMDTYSRNTIKPEAIFTPFVQHGSQNIAEFTLFDRAKERVDGAINWHGNNTSQWAYAGGLLVQNGRVSVHT